MLELPKLLKTLSLKVYGELELKKTFPERISHKVLETNYSFYVNSALRKKV